MVRLLRWIVVGAGLAGVQGAFAADAPRAVEVARTTDVPACTHFVDAAAKGGEGSAANPFARIADAVAAAESGAVICVAEGTYAEKIAPGEKGLTLAGGFKSGAGFEVRDSAKHVSKAQGEGSGSFLRVVDPGPTGEALTAIDGFEITGYSQAVVRDHWQSQRFDLTNNFIYGNSCSDASLAGAGASLANVTGTIRGNVFKDNACGRGGALALNDATNENTMTIEGNRVEGNSGTEPDSAHGGAFYLFGNTLKITGNAFLNNSVTQWGGGLYVGAYTAGNQHTKATLAFNHYRGNRAGNAGGGFFCDDGAVCNATNEVYAGNCGGNVLVDGGPEGSEATRTTFDHITSVGALSPSCDEPGTGFQIESYEALAPDAHTIKNALFWGNASRRDIVTACEKGCEKIKVSVDASMLEATPGERIKVRYGRGMVPPQDPLFVDAAAGDLRLQDGSPAKAKGIGGSDLGAAIGR